MAPELLTRDLVHNRDAIELPPPGSPVEARAERRDSYPIFVTRSIEETLAHLLELIEGAHVALIADRTVLRLQGETLIDGLTDAGLEPEVAAVPPGEQHKTLAQATELLDWLTGTQLTRRDAVLTFGGGVVIDMGGWVASAYMRGVPYVNLPTTLIGQVDAGIGGKLAVNHPVAKNLIGGFFQPRGVVSDVSFLRTLDRRQLRAGLAEAIKKAIIASPAYWHLIEAEAEAILAGDLDALERLVHGAGVIKAELIERDPEGRASAHQETIRLLATGGPASFACPDERSAMAVASVEVPAALVAPLRETVRLLYESTAEALHLAVREAVPIDEVHRHRERLRHLEALLERLGWSPAAAPGALDGSLELSGPREVLRDAIYGALIDAGERLAEACDGCWRGTVEPDGVRRAAAEVIALDRLLARIR